MGTRGAKKPIHQLLESYILHAIGKLGAREESEARELTKRAFKEDGDWRSRLRDEFGFTLELDSQLLAMWDQSARVAAEKGAELTPEDFAELVVEENFVDSVEMLSSEQDARASRPPSKKRL